MINKYLSRQMPSNIGLSLLAIFMLGLAGCGSGSSESEIASADLLAAQNKANIATKEVYVQAAVPTVYRFAKISNGAYFYTGSDVEVQDIIRNYPDFRYEGPAFERDTSASGQPVYRFANIVNGGYFYTGSEEERDVVRRDLPQFRYEGSTFSVAPAAQADSRAVYRLANLRNGAYLYTLSAAERDFAVGLGIWRAEGVSFRAPKGSPLSDRAWSTGYLMESGDSAVLDYQVVIDDAGRALSTYVKFDGTRNVLYSSRGIRNGSGVIQWTAASAIDLSNNGSAFSPYSPSSNRTSLKMSPNGNAIATWYFEAPCTSSAYYPYSSSNCRYVGYSTYNATSGAWSAAQSGPSSPSVYPPLGLISDNGSISILFTSWERSGTTSYNSYPGVMFLDVGQTVQQLKTFNLFGIYDPVFLSMDNSGNMLVFGQAAQNGGEDAAVYRGTPSGGFGPQVVIDQRASNAEVLAAATSLSGKSVVAYRQSNGTVTNALFIATLAPGAADWVVIDSGATASTTTGWIATVSDDNVGRVMRPLSPQLFSDFTGSWRSVVVPVPPNSIYIDYYAFNRNGDFVGLDSQYNLGRWVSFDARRNKYIQNAIPSNTAGVNSGFVVGFAGAGTSWTSVKAAVSVNGQGVIGAYGQYDVFPTTQVPLGDGRSGVKSLWGLGLN
jgi:Repeat of unknown function (DUF5648)